jgi:hypothetical protein
LREGLRCLREAGPLAAVPAAAGHTASFQAIEASLEWIAELGQAIRDYARGDTKPRAREEDRRPVRASGNLSE